MDDHNQENQDQNIKERLYQEFPRAEGPKAEIMARAIELGASIALLSRIAQYVERADPPEALFSWIDPLLSAYPASVGRQILTDCCFGNNLYNGVFQRALLADTKAWGIFHDAPAELEQILARLADNEANTILRLRSDLFQHLGQEVAFRLTDQAVIHLQMLERDEDLAIIERLPKRLQQTAAERLRPDWRSLPFIVKTLKGEYGRHHGRINSRLLYPKGGELIWKIHGPAMLRWALLGAEVWRNPNRGHQSPPPDVSERGIYRDFYGALRRAVEERGWRFAKAERYQGRLQAIDRSRHGLQFVFEHVPGPRGEKIAPGDEVIIPSDPTQPLVPTWSGRKKDRLEPCRTQDGVKYYQLELHRATEPTPAMLEQPEHFFDGQDLLPKKTG